MDTGSEHETELMQRTLGALAARTGFPVAFGGFCGPAGTVLTTFAGTRTGTLNGLLVEPGEGLGGLALARRQLTATGSYQESQDITHSYDHEVRGEGILTLLAVPVVVDDRVRALIYIGRRARVQLQNSVLDLAATEARRLAWELSVHDETQRRLAVLTAGGAGPHTAAAARERVELGALYAELRDIARQITDPDLAHRLESVGAMLRTRTDTPESLAPTVLSPRELDVIGHLALGKRNALIGTHLGLAESTVKSYLASAMRKLKATNRYEIVLIARRQGLVP